MQNRVANWPEILNRLIDDRRLTPFWFGQTDCCQFAAEIVSALTGSDHRSAFPAYSTRAEAEAILREHGGMVGLATSVMGEPKSVAWAQRGDLVAADFGDGIAIGVCLGVHSCAPKQPFGLAVLLTQQAIAVWTV